MNLVELAALERQFGRAAQLRRRGVPRVETFSAIRLIGAGHSAPRLAFCAVLSHIPCVPAWLWVSVVRGVAAVAFMAPPPRLPQSRRLRASKVMSWLKNRSRTRPWVLIALMSLLGALALTLILVAIIIAIPNALVQSPQLTVASEKHKAVSEARTVLSLSSSLSARWGASPTRFGPTGST